MKHLRIVQQIWREAAYYRAVIADPRTPMCSRWLIVAALAYLLNPIDLIPDFVPILGYLDDIVIVAGLIFLARAFIPKSVLSAHLRRAHPTAITNSKDALR